MKKGILKFGLFSMVFLGIVSCKNNEKELADKRIGELEVYVDSLKTVAVADMESNWDQIASDFDRKSSEANLALTNLDEETRNTSQQKIDAARSSYDGFKVTVETKVAETKMIATNPNQMLRDCFFGAGKIGEDMNFSWVNKNNILNVYDAFFQSYKDNKENFTREDYDEIKLMYEAFG